MDTCLFCTTARTRPTAPGGAVYDDEFVYAYHDSWGTEPGYLGRVVLVTHRHVPGFAELTDAEARALGLSVARLSQALKACTGAEKVYAEAYYEVVPHLHLYLTARYPGTPQAYWRGKITDWPEAPTGGPEAVAKLAAQLRGWLVKTGER